MANTETWWNRFWRMIFDAIFGPKISNYRESAKISEIKDLYNQVLADYNNSELSKLDDGYKLAGYIVGEALNKSQVQVSTELTIILFDTVLDLATQEAFFGVIEIDWDKKMSLSDQIELRESLKKVQNTYIHAESYLTIWAETLIEIFTVIFQALPPIISSDSEQDSFSVPVIHLMEKPKNTVEQVLMCFANETLFKEKIFQKICEVINHNVKIISGFDFEEKSDSRKKIIYPLNSNLEGIELSTAYFRGTPFGDIFKSPYPINIPISSRLEHTHILAGTGYGKTQLIQKLILDDLKENRGFCAIDSQGDLIRNISMLTEFDCQLKDNISDKLIIIDPTDTDYPACLNMFAMSQGLEDQSSSLQKELILNATVDLYSYMFGALFGAELTSRQGTVFAYIARLMIEIPDANIQTLRELMEDGKKYIPYMEKLEGSARAFFKTQFFSTSFGQSKRQVLSRLWAVLANPALERMFSNTENKVNVSDIVNTGKILLINTSKDLLQKDGSAILGRFFIALLSQAIIKRSEIPEKDRTPYMVYIDEAHEYFDHRLEDILNQARKYKVGFTLAHQNLGQLHELKATVASSTSVKLTGGISSTDAQLMAKEMRTSTDEILSVRKNDKSATFATYLKNITPRMLPFNVQFGLLEKKSVMPIESFQLLVEINRKKYCNHVSEIHLGSNDESFDITFGKPKPAKEIQKKKEIKKEIESSKKLEVVETPKEGKGGIQHRYLQNLVKKLANERDFKAIIEKQVLSGSGSVDVFLEGYDKTLAVEISVSTDWKWEASNISKCLATGADQVIVLSSDVKHLQALEDNLSSKFSDQANLLFFTADKLIVHLDKIRAKAASKEKTVKGYKVKVKYASTSKDEAQAKKDAIAKILVGTIRLNSD